MDPNYWIWPLTGFHTLKFRASPGQLAMTAWRRGFFTDGYRKRFAATRRKMLADCRHMGLSENRVHSQWNSHLIGIMISKTIGFRGTLFSDTPICDWRILLWNDRYTDQWVHCIFMTASAWSINNHHEPMMGWLVVTCWLYTDSLAPVVSPRPPRLRGQGVGSLIPWRSGQSGRSGGSGGHGARTHPECFKQLWPTWVSHGEQRPLFREICSFCLGSSP